MTRYAIDYQGWLYLEATDRFDAMNKAMEFLSETIPYEWQGGDWEIINVEVADD